MFKKNNDDNIENYTIQDSIILNMQRACEATIDIGMHIVAVNKFGVPQTSRDVFDMLKSNNIISTKTAKEMKAMVGFRNIVVHDYQKLNIERLKEILKKHLTNFEEYYMEVLKDAKHQ